MPPPSVVRLTSLALAAACLTFASACNKSSTPDPVLQTENFTGTLQPLGADTKTFTIAYAFSTTDLSVTINSLASSANGSAVTGITLGVGFGAPSGTSCSLQVQTPVANIGQELFAPNGAGAGAYCVQIFDCPTGTSGCTSTLTEAVNYSMTVKHY